MFYENFDRICKARGTSPSAVAVAIGKARTIPAGWKKNGTIPKEYELEALADVLGCEVSDFFQEVAPEDIFKINKNPKELVIEHMEKDGHIRDFSAIYNRLSRSDRLRLMAMIYDFEDELKAAYQASDE